MKNNKVISLFIAAVFLVLVATACSIDKTQKQALNGDVVNNDNPLITEKESNNSLDLSSQNLDKLNLSIFEDRGLEALNVSDNNLTGALPSQIGNLKSLRVLNASNNSFTGVPAEIGQLTQLEILDLSNNQLTGLPNELGNLKNLKQFNLSGNQYSEADLSIIQENLPNTEFILN